MTQQFDAVARRSAQERAPLRQSTMTQQCCDPNAVAPRAAAAVTPHAPPRSGTFDPAAMHGLEQHANENLDPDLDPDLFLPPGWQAHRGVDGNVIYFHKATGKFEASLADLFKKRSSTKKKKPQPTTRSPPARITPAALFKSTPPPAPPPTESAPPPLPDGATSSSCVIIPAESKIITRVSGVVDLVSAEDDAEETEDEDHDDEVRANTVF